MQDENKPKRPSVYDLTTGAEVILAHGALIEGEDEINEWYALIDYWAEKSEDKLTALRVIKKLAHRRIDSLNSEVDLFKSAITREEKVLSAMEEKAMAVMDSFYEITGKTKATTSDGGWVGIRTYKSEKVKIVDESVIPDGFMDVKRVPMRAELLSALKKDQDIPGVELERSERKGVQWGKMK